MQSIADFFSYVYIESEPFFIVWADYITSPFIILVFIILFFTILHINVVETSMTIATKIGSNKKYNGNIIIILGKILLQSSLISLMTMLAIVFTIGFMQLDKEDYANLKKFYRGNFSEKIVQTDNILTDYALYPVEKKEHKKEIFALISRYSKQDKSLNYAELKAISIRTRDLAKKEMQEGSRIPWFNVYEIHVNIV